MARVLALFVLLVGVAAQGRRPRGGVSDEQPVSDEVVQLFVEHGSDFKEQSAAVAAAEGANVAFEEFKPLRYRSQSVAGLNLFVRVQTSGRQFLDAWIFNALPYTGQPPKLEDVKFGVREEDEIYTWVDKASADDLDCGGCVSEEKEADEEVDALVSSGGDGLVKEALEHASARGRNGDTFRMFVPVRYATQWVAGRYWFVKVHVDEDEYMDIEIFEPLAYTGKSPEVEDVVVAVAREAAISTFGHGHPFAPIVA